MPPLTVSLIISRTSADELPARVLIEGGDRAEIREFTCTTERQARILARAVASQQGLAGYFFNGQFVPRKQSPSHQDNAEASASTKRPRDRRVVLATAPLLVLLPAFLIGFAAGAPGAERAGEPEISRGDLPAAPQHRKVASKKRCHTPPGPGCASRNGRAV